MTSLKPDPEWFKGPYANQWKRHAENVKALHDELVRRFPDLEKSIWVGLGAESAELIKIPPHERGEPDLKLYHEYKLLCHIEVSGSASPRVRIPPNPIYIRPDKLDLAKAKEDAGEPYFFWMVYHNVTWVVTASDAMPYRNTLVKMSPYGVREAYSEIPASVRQPTTFLFEWIQSHLPP